MKNVLIDIRNENECITEYFKSQDTVSVEDLLNAIDDLIYEKDYLEEKIEDMERDIEDNYNPISYEEQIGYSEHDFH